VLATLITELDRATAALEHVAPALRPRGLGGLELRSGRTRDRGLEALHQPAPSWQLHRPVRPGSVPAATAIICCRSPNTATPRLRTALVELAWRFVVWQYDCVLVKKWRPVFGNPKATKAAKKKAIVAMARQMAVDLWRWRTGRATPETFGWIMVGK